MTEQEQLLIKKIEISKNFFWLEKMLEKQEKFSDEVLEKIRTIDSLKIKSLLEKNYK